MLKERGEKFPIQDLARVSKDIKEKYGYVCLDGDLAAEFQKYDKKKIIDGVQKPANNKYFKTHSWESAVDKKKYTIDVGYERFLGPEMFFHPEFLDSKYRTSIDQIVDAAI